MTLSNATSQWTEPSIMWHEATQHWVMTMLQGNEILIYHSTDLMNWADGSEMELSEIEGGDWTKAELFAMSDNGAPTGKWIFLLNTSTKQPNGGSGSAYVVGEFDGSIFRKDAQPIQWLDGGKDLNHAVTWSKDTRRRTQRFYMGILSNNEYDSAVPTIPWQGTTSIPRQLTLERTSTGYALVAAPSSDLRQLRLEAVTFSRGDLQQDYDLIKSIKDQKGQYEMRLQFLKPKEGRIAIELYNSLGELFFVGYDVDQNEYYMDRLSSGPSDFSDQFAGRHVAPCYYQSDTVQMDLHIDQSSIELFADGGKTVMTDVFYPTEPFTDIVLHVDVAPLHILRSSVYSLRNIW